MNLMIMMNRAGRFALPCVAAGCLSAVAAAQTSAPPAPEPVEPMSAPRPSEGLHFRFTVDAWFPRLDGDVRFGIGGTSLDLGSDLEVDHTEATLDGIAELRWDPWMFWLSGFSFSTDGTSTATTPFTFGTVSASSGDVIRTSYDFESAAFEAGLALYRPLADQVWPWTKRSRNERNVAHDGDYRGDLRFVPFAGVRWIGLEHSLLDQSSGASDRFDADWIAIYGGLRIDLTIKLPEQIPFLDRLVIFGSGAYGGVVAGGSGTMFQVRAGLELFVCENFALSAGYQLFELDADEDTYELNGGLQGLWIGGTIWF